MLNVVIAFILETFLSRMSFQRSQEESGNDKEMETSKVFLSRADVLEHNASKDMVRYTTLFDDEVRRQPTFKKRGLTKMALVVV